MPEFECDCKYEPLFGPNREWVGGNFWFCPKHVAADVMLLVLEEVRAYLAGKFDDDGYQKAALDAKVQRVIEMAKGQAPLPSNEQSEA